MQTRRSFLSISAATVAGTVLPSFAAAQSKSVAGELFTPATLGAYQQNLLSKERMEKLVGSLFMVFLDTGNVAYLTLGKVVDLANLQSTPAAAPAPVGRPIIVSAPIAVAQPIAGTVKATDASVISDLVSPTMTAPIDIAVPAISSTANRTKGYVAIYNGETKKVPQGTYVVDHGRLGRVTIFMVPGRNEAGDTIVAATFAWM